ncbi:excisionase [Saccharomonospora piscinae]|uniref:Excisionase n=1 Tax=Saccharomonospora piscinae TaxID=687388 RepID=A0A1V9A7L9_SACPI|nr:helix-turn-helix domain-containing protein [Saccharomonospora piscinae]OQO93026.1 excisionase [Saccharomonospora piscinae]
MTRGKAVNNVTRLERLWTVDDVSDYLGVPVTTLYQWRSKGYGPVGRRIGRYVRYRPDDVRSWVESLETEVA